MKGDHLKILRYGFYYHHAIDLGDGNVIQYRGEPFSNNKILAEIAIDPIEKFIKYNDSKIEIVEYDKCFSVKKVIDRAMSRLGEKKYNVLTNNCEHFCVWCKTGKHYSQQTDEILSEISSILKKKLEKIKPGD